MIHAHGMSAPCGRLKSAITARFISTFAGYTNIAIGVSALFGYELPKNFDFPYGAASSRDFSRRWHISLSTWLRDYLYIPLGGSKDGLAACLRNIMITMILGGLWHGASWNFVLWGTLHGLGLCVQKVWREFGPTKILWSAWQQELYWVAALALTQLWVLMLWVFFRLSDFDAAVAMIARMVGLSAAGHQSLEGRYVLLLVGAPIVVDTLVGCLLVRRERQVPIGSLRLGMVLGVLTALMISAFALQSRPFIYFQF